MKFAILSLAAAAGLAFTADTASAQYRYSGSPYRSGFYNSGWSGTNITIGRPGGLGITIGSGNVYPSYYGGYNRPYYGGYNNFYRPSYGGYNNFYRPSYGYGGYRGYRW